MRRLSLLPSSPEYPTASELHRMRECVAPVALGLPEVSETSEWAEEGRRMHAMAEAVARGVEWIDRMSPEDISIWRLLQDMIGQDAVAAKWHTPAHKLFIEQGIKWRPGVLEDEVALCERQPGERLRGWFSGTADLVYVRADGVLVVVDWKFGPREHITGEPAKESCQGFFLATAFADLLSIRGSSAGVVVARFERRIVSEDGIEVDAVDITQGDIDAFAEQLRGLAERIELGVGAMPRISAACGKCKAKAECPAWDAQYAGIIESSQHAHERLLIVPETNEDAARMHWAIDATEALLDQWKEWVKAYVLTHPEGVPIGLGLRLKAIPSKDREVLDTPEALDVIERIASPGAIEVQRKSGIGRIAKALRDGAGRDVSSAADRAKTKKAAEENGFAALVKAGAVIDKGKKLTVKIVRSDEEE